MFLNFDYGLKNVKNLTLASTLINVFLVFLGIIIRFLVFQEGNLLNLLKKKAIVNMSIPINPMTSNILMV
jgi:hypothetical protein